MKSLMQKLRSLFEDRIVFFAVLVLTGCFFTLTYLALTGNADQVYTDIVAEDIAFYGSNKSAERSLFYILSLAGSALYFLYFMWSKQADRLSLGSSGQSVAASPTAAAAVILFVLLATFCLVYNEIPPLLFACFLCFLLLFVVERALVPLSIAFVCVCFYSGIAVYRLCIHLNGVLRSLPQNGSSADMAAFAMPLTVTPPPLEFAACTGANPSAYGLPVLPEDPQDLFCSRHSGRAVYRPIPAFGLSDSGLYLSGPVYQAEPSPAGQLFDLFADCRLHRRIRRSCTPLLAPL